MQSATSVNLFKLEFWLRFNFLNLDSCHHCCDSGIINCVVFSCCFCSPSSVIFGGAIMIASPLQSVCLALLIVLCCCCRKSPKSAVILYLTTFQFKSSAKSEILPLFFFFFFFFVSGLEKRLQRGAAFEPASVPRAGVLPLSLLFIPALALFILLYRCLRPWLTSMPRFHLALTHIFSICFHF